MRKSIYFLFILVSTVSCSGSNLHKPGLITEKAMVVSAHPLASQVGKVILQRGGNAVDAAIAVQFALAVVYPDAGNIGGGGFMVLRQHDGRLDALDYREQAPASAHRDMYLNQNKEVVPGLSTKGHLAAGVPGTVDGMVQAHQKYGSLPWAELVQPAVTLAARGFPLTKKEARKLNEQQSDFIKYNTRRPTFILKKHWRKGDTLRLPDLAVTMSLIRDKGRAGFYEGPTAEKIVAEMKRGKGLISQQDLTNYRAVWRQPVTGKVGDYRIISMPPPSSGGIALIQLLSISNSYPVQRWGYKNVKTAHLMIEAERRVYADRARHLGDPAFYQVPVAGLLNTAYIKSRMANFSPRHATRSKTISSGNPAPTEGPNTTHYSIIDPQGNAVSVTTTLN
ncbi:MAG: gamma-glutamyltransferase, partial [Bacteroidota bacterium]|nr:gamma-glutamyltransferase [Bacteroidota bacterium]